MGALLGFGQIYNGVNGIRFLEDGARDLFYLGERIARGKTKQEVSPYEYFSGLRFLDDFPSIEHWAFGDAWTGPISIGEPREEDNQLVGEIRYGNLGEHVEVYSISRSFSGSLRPIIFVGMPSPFDHKLNVPLRLVLGKIIIASLDGEIPYGVKLYVSSIVERGEVPWVFSDDMDTFGFHLAGYPRNLREFLGKQVGEG